MIRWGTIRHTGPSENANERRIRGIGNPYGINRWTIRCRFILREFIYYSTVVVEDRRIIIKIFSLRIISFSFINFYISLFFFSLLLSTEKTGNSHRERKLFSLQILFIRYISILFTNKTLI